VKLHYYPKTDSLYIELASPPGAETREITDGSNADFDAEGALVSTSTARRRSSISPQSRPLRCRSRLLGLF
jgi:uncharacterized protein YuzE